MVSQFSAQAGAAHCSPLLWFSLLHDCVSLFTNGSIWRMLISVSLDTYLKAVYIYLTITSHLLSRIPCLLSKLVYVFSVELKLTAHHYNFNARYPLYFWIFEFRLWIFHLRLWIFHLLKINSDKILCDTSNFLY